jgi:hypothetical protein
MLHFTTHTTIRFTGMCGEGHIYDRVEAFQGHLCFYIYATDSNVPVLKKREFPAKQWIFHLYTILLKVTYGNIPIDQIFSKLHCEKLHLKFCKFLMGVHKKAPNLQYSQN